MKLGRTKRELLESITYDDFVEQLAFYRLEPFGDEWRQAATIAFPHYVSAEHPCEIEDLMPLPPKIEPPIDPDEEQDIEAEIARTTQMFARKGIILKDETAR